MNRLHQIKVLLKDEIKSNGITVENAKQYKMKLGTLTDLIERLHFQVQYEISDKSKARDSTTNNHLKAMKSFDEEHL